MPTLSDTITMYVISRTAERLGRETVRGEERVLRYLLADIGNIQVSSIRPQHLDLFWSRHAAWSAGTLNTTRARLGSFFRWCEDRRYLRDGKSLIPKRRFSPERRERVIIPQEEFSTFIAGARSPRNRIALALGLYLFTRVSETETLRWQDLHDKEVEVWRSKTSTLDILPTSLELMAELDRWRFEYAAQAGQPPHPSWFIVPALTPGRFVGKQERVPSVIVPDKRARLGNVLAEELSRAGYYAPYEGGHTLRRSGAVALYNQLSAVGHDRAIRVCQAMLGHASIQNTEIYLRLDLDRRVRNELLAGKMMFPGTEEAQVIQFKGEGLRGEGRYQ